MILDLILKLLNKDKFINDMMFEINSIIKVITITATKSSNHKHLTDNTQNETNIAKSEGA